jgi:drug/metabolite transporter (DMT)-like permease
MMAQRHCVPVIIGQNPAFRKPNVMTWLPLALLCAFSLATADALTKRYLGEYTSFELVVVRFGVTGLLLAPLWLLNPLPPVPAAFWGWVAAALPLEVLAMLLYMRAIRDNPLALTLPYLAFTPVFATLTGFLLLGERVSWRGVSGILLVVAGAYLLNLERSAITNPRAWLRPLRALLNATGARLMLAVAFIYSLTSVLGKGALQYVSPMVFGPFYIVVLGVVTVGVLVFRRPGAVKVLWRRPAAHLAIGSMMGVMLVTHFLAVAEVEVAYMIAVKRISMIFGILYGALLFRERGLGRHLAAGALMVVGAALIVL